MPNRGTKQDKSLIDDVSRLARKGRSGVAAKRADKFVRLFYANVPPDDILGESPEDLAGAGLAMLDFKQARVVGKAKVRVYNPTPDEHGWNSSHTVIEIVNEDMPFLVDSVTAELDRYEGEVLLVIHPIIAVKRDRSGILKYLEDTAAAAADTARESVIHVQISEQPTDLHDTIREGLEQVLEDVRVAIADWRAMRQRCHDMITQLEITPPKLPVREIAQGVEFLKWLDDDHFTYLGYREYTFQGKGASATARIHKGSGLGVLRDPKVTVFEGLRALGKLPPDVRHFLRQPQLIRISKSNRRATVHRPVHMDTISVKTFDASGKVTGERLFVGLFTSVAYSRSPRDIPLLRDKVEHVMQKSGFPPSSHDGKTLMHILETYPRQELFQVMPEELADTSRGVLHLQERQRVALFVRRDHFDRFVSCLVYVPRDRYDTAMRLKLQSILEESFAGQVESFDTHFSDSPLARLHVIIKTERGKIPPINMEDLERKLAEAARSWTDRLQECLVKDRGEEQGIRATRRFGKAFSVAYQDRFSEHVAVHDIERIEKSLAGDGLALSLYRPPRAKPHQVRFKIYFAGEPVPLSDVLPMLENMGLRVIGEVPYDVRPAGAGTVVSIQDFKTATESGASIDIDPVRDAFHDAFRRIWRGDMENDGFNKLVLLAGLRAREVVILRSYCKYLRQAAIPFSEHYMWDTLARNPEIARLLVDLFLTLFDPHKEKGVDASGQALQEAIERLLDDVSNLDEDRIIRRFLNAILSTLRTNYFQSSSEGGEKSYVSIKIDSRNVEELPLPRPFREIFVYSPRIEGVHLRFGMVARGGLRWSDRREDFRTEILGLVKAQQVKNSVIVPVGSKGGFVVKRPPPADAGRDAFQNEGIECYKTFISGLLDITDNLQGAKLVPPKDVVRRDGNDPYLVVAADKGTATFSDIANGVSADYGFWLDDAFASGGSAGYDHKKMAITARGAWESVKRHFREMDKNTQEEDFTCIGVGDMSGDVFGNGMLLSKHICLIGAFNHLHIFFDPNPNAAKSWAERKRLFDLPRSSWTDYNAKLISKGGGIFDRKAKSIKVTPEMKQVFGITRGNVTPNELVKAILMADVELLWFGGIGTYIKAREESNADAGDRANDAVRLDANDVKAKVIGEGANLGVTQLGRIAFDMQGGRINTDSIDNSAGVDCSDHEVNIKILLGDVEQSKKLSRTQRNKLLETMTDEVADLVLRDNYMQTQAITVTHQLGPHLLDRLARFMRGLERSGDLNRDIEFLPDDDSIIDRQKVGIGLSRPELAVLLSYAKIVLYDQLLESDLPDDTYLSSELTNYFPTPLRSKYRDYIARHRLRREIVATVATNSLVNRVGPAFVHEVQEKTGLPQADITRGYIISRQIYGMRDIWREIEVLDNKVAASLQAKMLIECGRLIERTTVWFLREGGYPLDIRAAIEGYGESVRYLMDHLESLLSATDCKHLDEHAQSYIVGGAPKELAARIARLSLLSPACDIVRIAQSAKLPVEQVGHAYFTIGARFGFDWLRLAAGRLPTDTAWDKLAVTAIIDDLFGHQGELTTRVLDAASDGMTPEIVIDTWAENRRPLVARTEQLLAELQSGITPDLAMLAVANRQLKSMVAS